MSATLAPADLDALVQVATTAVRRAVLDHRVWRPATGGYPTCLRAPGAAFVTLRRDGRLRGCIGSLVAREPLVTCVADRARAAALADPRFEPIRPAELADLQVEVSVLGEPEPMDVTGYDDLLHSVRPGVDGVIVEATPHRATLLPSVWDDLPDPADFLDALWRKAGLPPRAWPAGTEILRYRAQRWPP